MLKFKNVAVGISGGVDSAVAALLLKKKGFNVQGVFMQNWDIRDEKGVCTTENDYEDALYVCKKLNIDLHHKNFVKEYWNDVFCPLIKEYEMGLTPNPDILCNKHVKFNHFQKFAFDDLNADAIATGHYANTTFGPFLENYNPNSGVKLLLAKDRRKDQTFFLSQIHQKNLLKTMFPLGNFTKSEVKQIAHESGLQRIALKPESMGICFIGSRNFQEFIEEYVPDKPGKFIDIDTGQIVGTHTGLHKWTLGQRARLGGFSAAYFVARKNVEENIIYVVQDTKHPLLYTDLFCTTEPHWIHSEPAELNSGGVLKCNFKFQHTELWDPCEIFRTKNGMIVHLLNPKRAITPGQYAVFSRNDECLGSAKIVSGMTYFSYLYFQSKDEHHKKVKLCFVYFFKTFVITFKYHLVSFTLLMLFLGFFSTL